MRFALLAASSTAPRRALAVAALGVLLHAVPALPAAGVSISSGDDDTALADLLADHAFLRPAPVHRVDAPSPPRVVPVAATPDPHHADERADDADPLEPINRYAHELNGYLRRHLLEPVTAIYLDLASPPVQTGVSNIFANLREPLTVANNLLLGDTQGANNAAARFAINSTAGLGGFYDLAAEQGYARHPRTLEEVLCRYQVPSGPYLVLPILGPATARDAAGRITTLFIQYAVLGPIYIPYRILDIAVQFVDHREQLRFIEQHSLDTYVAHRSAHRQLHARLACDGQTVHIELFGQ